MKTYRRIRSFENAQSSVAEFSGVAERHTRVHGANVKSWNEIDKSVVDKPLRMNGVAVLSESLPHLSGKAKLC